MDETQLKLDATKEAEHIENWAKGVIDQTLMPDTPMRFYGLGSLRGRNITIRFDLLQPEVRGELTRRGQRIRATGVIHTRIATVSVLRLNHGDVEIRIVRIFTDAPDDDQLGKPLILRYMLELPHDESHGFRVVTWTQGDLEDFDQAYADQERERNFTSVAITIEREEERDDAPPRW